MKNDQERKLIIIVDGFSLVLNMFGVSWENSGRALFDTGDQLQSGRTESTTQSLSVSEQQVKIKRVQARHICFTGRAGA